MRKLTLDPDALAVESFEASAEEAGARGTGEGREMGARTPYWSAIDAFPKRPCSGRC